jgi:hypothetical protein
MFSDIVRQASEITNNISALFQLLYRHREQLDSLFRFFDTDGSGEVSIDEMVDAMKVLVSILDTELVISDEDLRGFAVGLDKNDDGNVDYDEFFDLFATLDEAYSISSDNQHEHGIHRTTSLNKVRSIDKMLDHAISSSKDRDTLKPKKIANIHPDDFKPLDKISIAQHDELVNHAASVMSIDVDAAQVDHPVPNSSANTPIERNVTIDFKTLD